MPYSRFLSVPARCRVLWLSAALAALAGAPVAYAADAGASARVQTFSVAPGPLELALSQLAVQAGLALSFDPALTQGLRTAGLQGSYEAHEAFARLLSDTGLRLARRGDGSYTLQRGAPAAGGVAQLPVATVTGAIAGPALPEPYAGGQVARGARLGILGDRDYMQTPFSATSYTRQRIEDQQARSVADVVGNNDPSVRLNTNANTIGDGFTIRGFGFESAEVSFNGLSGIAPVWRIMPQFLERIDVLKGPNAFLNGALTFGSVGGAIVVVPKRAGAQDVTQATATYASDSMRMGHLDIGRRFGAQQAFGVRVNGTYGEGEGPRDHLRERSEQLAVALDYQGERLSLEFDAMHQQQLMRGVQWFNPSLGAGVTQVPRVPSGKLNWIQPWEYSDVRERIVAARAEYRLSDRVTAYAAAGRNRSDQYYLTALPALSDDQGTLDVSPMFFVTPYETRTVDVGLRGNLDTGAIGHEWNIAYTRLHNTDGMTRGFVGSSFSSNLYDPVRVDRPVFDMPSDAPLNGERRLESYALSDTLSFLEGRLQTTLGLRRQQVRSDAFDPSGARISSYDRTATTPMAGVMLQVTPSFAVYGNYIEGLSPGGSAPAGAINAGESFAPFKSKQIEAGVKFDWDRLGLVASVFEIRRPSGVLDPATLVYSADGEQRNTGLELNVFGEPLPGWRVLGGAALIDARLQRTAAGLDQGNRAPNQAYARVNLELEKSIATLPGLALSVRYIHTGAQYLDNANTLRIPAWNRWDLGARYQTKVAGKAVTVRLNVENAFDKDYYQQNLLVGSPRTLVLSTSVAF